MKCNIREMRKDEFPRVIRVIQMHDGQDARYAQRYYREYFKRWGRGWDKIIVAEARGHIVGVSGYFYDNQEALGIYWLGYTYIHPKFQGQGIGKQLLEYILKDLRRRKARKLFLATSTHAIYAGAVSFYTERGFRWEGTLKDFYGLGEDQILMGKDMQLRRRPKAKRRPKKKKRRPRRRARSRAKRRAKRKTRRSRARRAVRTRRRRRRR